MRAQLAIELQRAGDGTAVARGDLAATPYWCRWDGATLWIVGSAATPVGEDDIGLDLVVGEGVTASVRSVAAVIVYAARGAGTRLATRLHIADGASLLWQPEPVIVTRRAHHRSTFTADVASGGRLVADEAVVFGRSDETAGRFRSTTELRRDGAPVSITAFDTDTPAWSGPGGTGGAKVLATRVVFGADADDADDVAAGVDAAGADGGRPTVDPSTVVLRPEAGGAIVTALARDPATARSQLDAAWPVSELLPVG